MRLAILTILTLALAACSDMNTLPDITKTGQLLVAYQPDTQGVMLTPGTCSEAAEAEAVITAEQDVTARLYYALEPGAHCLTWGPLTSPGVFDPFHQLEVDVQAGALDFVSVIPNPITTQ